MRERYEAGGISFRALGKLYGVTERAVSRHAQDEDWYGQRRWSRTKRMETQTCLANVARQLNRAAASAAERMDMGEADVREIKELAGLLQSLEPPQPPEKKSGGTVRVVLSGEAEELSQ